MDRRPPHRAIVAAVAGLALAAAAAAAEPGPAPPGRRYALLVGVGKYGHNLRELPYAVPDVTELAAVLRGHGYEPDNVWLMTPDAGALDPSWWPSRGGILAKLDLLLQDRRPQDSILLAFAGHGVRFLDDPDTYFCPVDADLAARNTLISVGDVYRRLKECRAGVKVVLVDACRNDPRADTSRSAQEIDLGAPRFQRQEPPGGTAVLFSCSEGQEAFEDAALRHGVFFHFVIEGLKGKAADRDGTVTLLRLYDYLADPVDDYARRHKGHSQRPSLVGELRGPVPLVTAAAPRREGPAPTAQSGEVCRLTGHEQVVTCVAFFPDGRHALSGSLDGTLRVWDLETGKETARLRTPNGSWVRAVAVSPDGRLVLSGGEDGVVRVWDVATRREVWRLLGHRDVVYAVAFASDGRRAASASEDGTVRLWDGGAGTALRRFTGHEGKVRSVAFEPGGHYLLSGGSDGTVRLWDVDSGRQARVLAGHAGEVWGVAFSPGGSLAVSAGRDGTLRVWDVQTGRQRQAFAAGSPVLAVAFAPDGRYVVSGDADGSVRLWDLNAGASVACFKGHETAVHGVALAPDGRRALSAGGAAGRDNTVRLWALPVE